MALIRPAFLAALIYLGYAVAFPDYVGTSYHAAVLIGIAGGSVGLWFLKKLLDFGEGTAKILVEIVFLVAVALFVGYTMPQKSGKAPLEQWSEGVRPTREHAARGFKRLGVDPDGPVASRVVALFPKR
ncbi:MAG: hypothetical protein HY079_01760 [Elusimicrobia bacterium]|nr:hypothetical protein [Elusimicrobiota bacterium]